MKVRVANGHLLHSSSQLDDMELWSQGHTFHTTMRVLDMTAYDAILGYDWLKAHRPMVCHWEHKTLEFKEGNQIVLLQGIRQPQHAHTTISPEQLIKWQKCNDIWALAVVQQVQMEVDDHIPTIIARVLEEFPDVFSEPKELPPYRDYDYTITLLPDVAPVNSRPYR
jgi:hypothetical protein